MTQTRKKHALESIGFKNREELKEDNVKFLLTLLTKEILGHFCKLSKCGIVW